MLIFPIVNFVEKTINVEKVIVLHMAKRAQSAMEKITFKLNVAVLIIALSNPKKLFLMINHLQMIMYISTILHTFQIEALSFALLQVNGCKVGFQLDTGADVNIICQRYVKKEQVQPSFQKLTMWNHSTLQPVGEAMLTLHNPKSNLSENVKFVVVQNRFNCLLGLDTILKMNLLTVNDNAFLANIEAQPELGDLGCVSLHVDSNVQPRILPCRNISLSLRNKVKAEIDKLMKLNVLEQITEPTKWVNQVAVVKKKNGDLRICIDPQPLNCALSREHYRLPVIDDVLPFLSKAKWFTKLDVKHAYWHVSLDAESSKLTTMITPFGRFC